MDFTKEQEEFRARLIERLQSVENVDLLEEVQQILDTNDSGGDFWQELSEDQKSIAMKGLDELKDGKGISAGKVIEDLKQ